VLWPGSSDPSECAWDPNLLKAPHTDAIRLTSILYGDGTAARMQTPAPWALDGTL